MKYNVNILLSLMATSSILLCYSLPVDDTNGTAIITSTFGELRSGVYEQTPYDRHHLHTGVDIDDSEGSKLNVIAVIEGFIRTKTSTTIRISDENEAIYYTYFEFDVTTNLSVGDPVIAGTVLGKINQNGSTHLHFVDGDWFTQTAWIKDPIQWGFDWGDASDIEPPTINVAFLTQSGPEFIEPTSVTNVLDRSVACDIVVNAYDKYDANSIFKRGIQKIAINIYKSNDEFVQSFNGINFSNNFQKRYFQTDNGYVCSNVRNVFAKGSKSDPYTLIYIATNSISLVGNWYINNSELIPEDTYKIEINVTDFSNFTKYYEFNVKIGGSPYYGIMRGTNAVPSY